MKKDIKILISSLFIFISFFLWYILSEIKNKNNDKESYNYVNIEILKTKIKISKDEKTRVTIDWNIVQNEIYDIK